MATLLTELEADVLCVQETKLSREMLDVELACVPGWNSYYSFSQARPGYSGVAIFCRDPLRPRHVHQGLAGLMGGSFSNGDRLGKDAVDRFEENEEHWTHDELVKLDREGRAICLEFELAGQEELSLFIISVYCPRGDAENEERLSFKARFQVLLQSCVEALLSQSGRCHVILAGDFNVAHRSIDHCEPESLKEPHRWSHRLWLDGLLVEEQREPQLTTDVVTSQVAGGGPLVDTYRWLHPDVRNAFTCWRSLTSARQTNYGTRIDLVLVNEQLCRMNQLRSAGILSSVQGSDHCPIYAELQLNILSAQHLPPQCSRLYPEFSGRQRTLLDFVFKKTASADIASLQRCGELLHNQKSHQTSHSYRLRAVQAASSRPRS